MAKGYVTGPSPTKGVKLALIDEKPPFKTWNEIETIIKRGGLTEDQQKEYWDCLFLDEKQILELLDHVQEKAEHPFIYAAIAFAAFTGARRSEIVRSQIEDWDFERGIVRIREKKGSRKKKGRLSGKSTSTPDSKHHEGVAQDPSGWSVHDRGPANMANSRNKHPLPSPLTPDQAHDHFHRTTGRQQVESTQGLARPAALILLKLCPTAFPTPSLTHGWGTEATRKSRSGTATYFASDTRRFMESQFMACRPTTSAVNRS